MEEIVGFIRQDQASQTNSTHLAQLKDILSAFESLRGFAEKLNAGSIDCFFFIESRLKDASFRSPNGGG